MQERRFFCVVTIPYSRTHKSEANQRDGYLYFLFEHKSYTSKNVVLQLLNYMVRIWEQKAVKENARQIPVIIPILIYHGKEKWGIGDTLADLIIDYDALPEEVKEMTPNFRYQIYDLSQFSDEDIKGNAQLAITLSIFRDVFQKSSQAVLDTIIQAARAMNELEEKETGIQYFARRQRANHNLACSWRLPANQREMSETNFS
ncbi:Rpn family recombination-promoting nuclease/putative transposase [Acetobacterium tundrae]|uniref:Transposase (putative) YhgA-like domain-containing protein n=1 Tax=Acetobacterium tundrae TaxID=132932 RepID=A0ABR6WQD0_9FIRM|nr:Rpn family recombination-promoting nuclease/putative transposase [Acetobacterium tundrae]MBC3798665.1 hypothetical protein [Acetobacterium tundrae]